MQPFKRVILNCESGLRDEEININGYGIVVLKNIPGLKIKFDNKLNDALDLANIEGMFKFEFEKIYISAPETPERFEMYIMTDQNAYVDVNTQFDKLQTVIKYYKNIGSIATRGNDYDYRLCSGTGGGQVFTRSSETAPVIFVRVDGDLTGWQIITEMKNKNGKITREFPVQLLTGNGLSLNIESILFNPVLNAADIKVYVEYFIT